MEGGGRERLREGIEKRNKEKEGEEREERGKERNGGWGERKRRKLLFLQRTPV